MPTASVLTVFESIIKAKMAPFIRCFILIHIAWSVCVISIYQRTDCALIRVDPGALD